MEGSPSPTDKHNFIRGSLKLTFLRCMLGLGPRFKTFSSLGLCRNLMKQEVSIEKFQPGWKGSSCLSNPNELIKTEPHKHTPQYHQEQVKSTPELIGNSVMESQGGHWNKSPGSECQLSRQPSFSMGLSLWCVCFNCNFHVVMEEAKSKVVALCEDQCFQMPFALQQHQADKEEAHRWEKPICFFQEYPCWQNLKGWEDACPQWHRKRNGGATETDRLGLK